MKPQDETKDKRPFFVNESGRVVHVRPVEIDASELINNSLMDEYREKGRPVDPPEIEIETAGGGKVKRLLSQATVTVASDETETARRQELWDAHLKAKSDFDIEFGKLSMDLILDGIDEPIPPDEEWIPFFRHMHISVPEDALEREFFYKRHVLVKTPGDLAKLQSEVLILSSSGTLDRKRVEAKVEAFFREARVRAEDLDDQGTESQAPEEPLAA